MEKFGCLGLLVILLGLLVVWGTILNIPNAGECLYDEHRRDEQSMELLNKWWVKARGSNWSEIANEECVPP